MFHNFNKPTDFKEFSENIVLQHLIDDLYTFQYPRLDPIIYL